MEMSESNDSAWTLAHCEMVKGQATDWVQYILIAFKFTFKVVRNRF